ncbi:MAG: MmcQ/YjbR family DNA-binding protein [Deltaproteobacteria bacterium]
MNIEQVRDYCLKKQYVEESLPFGDDTLVFKIFDKIFALLSLDEAESPRINIKGNPDKNIELREKYEAVIPGYHMNKTHWNTVLLESDLNDQELMQLIDDSYALVAAGLPKRIKETAGL